MRRIFLIIWGFAVAFTAVAQTNDATAQTTDAVAQTNDDEGGNKPEMETGKEKFDRGIVRSSDNVFIPKGYVGAGLKFSYNNYSVGNGVNDTGYSMLLSLLQDLHGQLQTIGVSPHFSYFVRDNLAVGARFSYDRTLLGIGNLDFSLGDDLNFEVSDYDYVKNSYSLSLLMRNYVPFGNSKRFALFTELRLTGGYGESKTYKTKYDDVLELKYKDGTFQNIFELELGLITGLMVFMTNDMAIEVSVGSLGFNYQHVVQTTNQVDKSEMEQTGANFKVNLLSISFGLTYYIPTKAYYKNKKS